MPGTSRLINNPVDDARGKQPFRQIDELGVVIAKPYRPPIRIRMTFRDINSDGILCHLSARPVLHQWRKSACPMLVIRACRTCIRSGPWVDDGLIAL